MTWAPAGVSADAVFGRRGVHVFAGAPTEDQIPPGFPWALVGIDDGDHDEDHPELITQGFTIIVAAEVAGDPMGQHAIIGSSIANLGKSVGRGVLEVSERARLAIQNLTGVDGAKIMLSATSTGAVSALGNAKHIALGSLTLSALCTSQPHYAPPQELAESSDTWTWAGAHCSDRFDFIQYKLVRKTGSAPQTVSDGTLIYTGTAATASHTPVSGDTYAIFAEYDARGTSLTAAFNDPDEVGAVLVK